MKMSRAELQQDGDFWAREVSHSESETSSQNVEQADAAMNDHAMDARITETLYRLHEAYGNASQNSESVSRRMATPVEEEAAAIEPIDKIWNQKKHIYYENTKYDSGF
jgi:hypothetical protein